AARQAAPPAREALSGPPTRATAADAREPLVAGPAVEPKSPSPTPASAMDAVIKPPASAGKATDQTAVSLRADTAEDVWRQTRDRLVGLVAESAAAATRTSVDRGGRLVASFPNAFYRDICQRNLPRLLAALEMVCGAKVGLELTTHEPSPDEAAPAQSSPAKQQAELATHPFVERAIELFDGDPSRVRVTPAPASN
ncbi:MAG TPA: hypothetical protein PKC18_09855, partial [Lacipirellulaceae bacterium]|nr:hypothetical protein [Lacipirellulaceae bacterium]